MKVIVFVLLPIFLIIVAYISLNNIPNNTITINEYDDPFVQELQEIIVNKKSSASITILLQNSNTCIEDIIDRMSVLTKKENMDVIIYDGQRKLELYNPSSPFIVLLSIASFVKQKNLFESIMDQSILISQKDAFIHKQFIRDAIFIVSTNEYSSLEKRVVHRFDDILTL